MRSALERRGVPHENIGDGLDIVEHHHRHARRRQRRIGGDGDDGGVVGMEERLAEAGAVDFELGMRLALETLDHHEVDRRELFDQRGKRELRGAAQLVHEGEAVG